MNERSHAFGWAVIAQLAIGAPALADGIMVVIDSTSVHFAKGVSVTVVSEGKVFKASDLTPGEFRKFYGRTYCHAPRATTVVHAASDLFTFHLDGCPMGIDLSDQGFVVTVMGRKDYRRALQVRKQLRNAAGLIPACWAVSRAAFDSALAIAIVRNIGSR